MRNIFAKLAGVMAIAMGALLITAAPAAAAPVNAPSCSYGPYLYAFTSFNDCIFIGHYNNGDWHIVVGLDLNVTTQHAQQGIMNCPANFSAELWGSDVGRPAGLLGDAIQAGAARLNEQRLAATERCVELELALGRHRELVGELTQLASEHPLREQIVAHLMLALYRCGRQADALQAFQRLRARLADQLGIDPSSRLQQLHTSILRNESIVAPDDPGPSGRRQGSVPAHLPADFPGFIGRTRQLKALDELTNPDTAAAVVISAIAGTAGIGKTALAVYWAHRVAERFPDGQLYVNLRGFDASDAVVTPAAAVRQFLDAFGVPPQRVPADPDARVNLYRTLLAGKRILVVLDNARDPDQVRPLLPGGPDCVVLITSRNQLTGLIATEGARHLALDLLTTDEARDLLERRLDPARVRAEPGAVDEIISACARLPLALAIVAARAAIAADLPLAVLADQLRTGGDRLDTLSTGDDPQTDLRAVFSWSYRALTPDAARLFRLLGLHPGADISAPAAAGLAGIAVAEVRPLLAELTRASLLTEPTPGRYALHDLLRDYAGQLAGGTDTGEQRDAATGRILDHYLHTAHAAAWSLYPTRDPLPLAPPSAGVTPEQLTDSVQPLSWFTVEHQVLLAAVAHAAATGFDTHTWQLAWTLSTFLDRRGHWHDWLAVAQAAVAATQRLADAAAQSGARRNLAGAYTRLGRLDDAHAELRQALDLAARVGDQTQQALTHVRLAYLCERRASPAQALHHARQGLSLYSAAGHRPGQAQTLNIVGWYHALLGEYQQALTHCQQALPLLQQLGDRLAQAATWDSLGYAHHHLGQHSQATTSYEHALTLYREVGARYEEASTLTRLGDTHHATGEPHAARDTWLQSLSILEALDHPDADNVRAMLSMV